MGKNVATTDFWQSLQHFFCGSGGGRCIILSQNFVREERVWEL